MNTDNKLLTLISGGNIFTNELDPDGLLQRALPAKIFYNSTTGSWSLRLNFDSGDILLMKGHVLDDESIITQLKMPSGPGEIEEIPFSPSKTLYEGLGPLNGVAARLRRNLAPAAPLGGEKGKYWFMSGYWPLIDNALLWDTELHTGKNPLEGFDMYHVTYQTNERGSVVEAKFSLTRSLLDAEITISADADLYGLGNKKVRLIKNMGMYRRASIDCILKKEHPIPSLKLAMDLYNALPILYEKERKKNKDLTPKKK